MNILSSCIADIEREATHQEKDAVLTYRMIEGADPHISPLHWALAVWGLTVDDILSMVPALEQMSVLKHCFKTSG